MLREDPQLFDDAGVTVDPDSVTTYGEPILYIHASVTTYGEPILYIHAGGTVFKI